MSVSCLKKGEGTKACSIRVCQLMEEKAGYSFTHVDHAIPESNFLCPERTAGVGMQGKTT